jgi:hypothetical protein
MKLKLAPDNRKVAQQQTDEKGTVVVKIFLAHKGHSPKKGNINRTIRLTGKVSDVYAAIMELCETEADSVEVV